MPRKAFSRLKTRECWASAFDRFDRNSDGIISAEDVRVLESATTKKNLTCPDLRAGIAIACHWYPEECMQLIVHEPLITPLVFDDADIGELPPPAPASPVNGTSLMLIETENPALVGASVQVAVGCMGLAFGMLGIETPSGALVADLVQTNSRAVSLILDIVRKMDNFDDMTKMALDVNDILEVLYDEGILSAALQLNP